MPLLIKKSTLLKVLQISTLQQTFWNIKFEELILQIIANNRHNLIVFHKRYSSNPGVDKHNTSHLVLNEIWPCIQWICIVESYVNFFTVLFFTVIVRCIWSVIVCNALYTMYFTSILCSSIDTQELKCRWHHLSFLCLSFTKFNLCLLMRLRGDLFIRFIYHFVFISIVFT